MLTILTMFLYAVYLLTPCLSDFNLWDYCQVDDVCSMPGDIARYAYGSAYEPGSTEWYQIGGTIYPDDRFINIETVAKITIPTVSGQLSAGFDCSSAYDSNLPQALAQNNGAMIGDEIYSFGGFNNNWQYVSNIYQSDKFVVQSTFDDASCALPVGRSAACSVTIGSKVYIIGGLKNGNITDTVYVVDLSADPCTVTELAPMLNTRFAPSCSTNEGKIFVFGGQEFGDASNWYFGDDLDSIEIYDIASDSWSLSAATLSYKAHWANAAYLKLGELNLTLIMGGITGFHGVFDNLDVYNMDLDAIIDRTTMPSGGKYAFSSITLPHDDWESRYILSAGGKYFTLDNVTYIGEVVTEVEALWCEILDEPETTMEPESIAAQTRIVMVVAVVMLIAFSQ